MAKDNGELCERGMNFARKIVAERAHQIARFSPDGTEEGLNRVDDEKNDAPHFAAYAAHYAMRWFPGGFGPWNQATFVEFKRCMVKAATIAYAAHEWADRRLAEFVQPGTD